MKKFLAILLAAIMCLGIFAGCKPKEADGPQLSDAVTYLESLYKDGKEETPADYDVVGKIMIDTAEFTVTWETDNAQITVKESDKAGFYTIDVPSKTDAKISYTLKATIKDKDGNTQTVEFKRVVPVVDTTEIVYDLKENTPYKFYVNQNSLGLTLYATGETQNDKFLITSTDPKEGADFYAEIVDGGYKFYIMKNGSKAYVTASTETGEDGKVSKFINFNGEGSVWTYKKEVNGWFTTIDGGEYVVGTYNSYDTLSISEGTYLTADNSGISQFPAGFMEKAVAENKGVSTPNAGEPISATIAEILAMTAPSGAQEYIVEGTVDEVQSTTYGNMYIKDASGNKLLIYGLYDSTGTVRYDALSKKPVKGDKVKVQGPVAIFNDEVEIKNAKLLELNGVKVTTSAPVVTPSTPAVEGTSDIKEGTAYKLFVHQASLNKTLYALAETSNDKFIKTDVDAKNAPDFYAEKVTGGYKFYTTVSGAKKYLTGSTQVGEDDKVSKFLNYGSTGSVWYYKKDVNAWFTKIDGAEYVLGTYNTYDTLSLSEAKYITAENTGKTQFPGNFVAKATAEAAKPSEDTTPTTSKNATIAEVLAMTTVPSYKVIVEGTIDSTYGDMWATYGNFYIKDSSGNKLLIYGLYDAAGTRYDKMTKKPAVGDKIKVESEVSFFNSAPQLKNATLLSINGTAVSTGSSSGSGTGTGSGSGTQTGTSDIKVNTAYKIVVNNGTAYYAKNETQDNAGKFVLTDANAANGADYYAEQASDGWKFYTTISGAKKYLTGSLITESGKDYPSKYLGFSDTGSVFKYNSDVSAWYTTIDGADYYMGTYGTWTTISLSDSSYFTDATKRATQYEANFVESSSAGSGSGSGSGSGDGSTTTPINATIAELAAMTTDSGTQEYIVEGTVTGLYNTQYGNMYITDGTNQLTIYGLYDANGNRYDAMTTKPVDGDTIKVQGPISIFNNNPQIKNATLISHTPASGDSGSGDGGSGDSSTAGTTATLTASAMGYENAQELSSYAIDSVVTLSASAGTNSYGNTPKYYNSGSALRFYTDNTFTISAASGYKLSSVKISTVSANYAINAAEVSAGTVADAATTTCTISNINAASLTITNTNTNSQQIRITGIEVTYVADSTTATLTASAMGYENAQELSSYAIDSVVTLSASVGTNSNGNTPKYYNSGSALRFYTGNTFTISAASGYKLSSVKISTVSASYAINAAEVSAGTVADAATTTCTISDINAASLTITNTNTNNQQIRITGIEVTYVAE